MIGRRLLATALLATLATVSVSAETYNSDVVVPTKCPETDPLDTTIHIAHEWDCTRFYTCFNGEKILTTCADRDYRGNRLHFDPVLQVCVWPENSTCSNNDGSSPVTTEGSVSTEKSEPTENAEPEYTRPTAAPTTVPSNDDVETSTGSNLSTSENNNNEESNTSAAPSLPDEPENTEPIIPTECPAENEGDAVHIAHESDCGKFYQCDSGQKVLKECANGLQFNPVLQVCDWSENVNCSSNGGGSGEEPEPTIPSNDDVETSTGSNLSTSENNNNEESNTSAAPSLPDEPENTEPIIPTECPAENEGYAVHIAHESDCGKFYQCDSGQKILKECANGLQFNPVLQVCDWSENVGCSSNGSGSGEEPEPTIPSNDDVETSTGSNLSTTENNNKEESNTSTVSNLSTTGNNNNEESNTSTESNLSTTGNNNNEESNTSTESNLSTSENNNNEESNTSAAPSLPDEPDNTEPIIPTECPAENEGYAVHIAHESDCGKFYQCDWGQKVLKECPSGLHFNAVLQVCDWPENVGCSSNGGSDVEETKPTIPSNDDVETSTGSNLSTTENNNNEESNTSTESNLSTTENNNNEESDTSTEPSLPDESEDTEPIIPTECPAENEGYAVHIAHESDCGKFYQCDWGQKVLKECPSGLHFNAVLQVCDWPENVGCSSNGGSDVEETKPTIPSNDDVETSTGSNLSTTENNNNEESNTSTESNLSTTENNNNEESNTSTESNLSTTENNNNNEESDTSTEPSLPEEPENTEPIIPTECPAENEGDAVHIAHESDCGKFYQCDSGQKVLKECANGLQFNPVLQVCDWPENVGCSSNGGSGGEEPEPTIPSNDDVETSTVSEEPEEIGTTPSNGSNEPEVTEEIGTTPSNGSNEPEVTEEIGTTPSNGSNEPEVTEEIGTTPSNGSNEPEVTEEIGTTPSNGSNEPEVTEEIGTTPSNGSNEPEEPEEIGTTASNGSNEPEVTEEIGTTPSNGSNEPEVTEEIGTTSSTDDPNEFEWTTPVNNNNTTNKICPLAFISHECKCNLFYQCDEQGRWIRRSCASGLQFNNRTQVCDWPHNVRCVDGAGQTTTAPTEVTTSLPIVTPTSAPVVSTTKATTTTEATTVKQPATPADGGECNLSGTCPSVDPLNYTVLLAHTDCTKYCMCSNGVSYVRNCPGSLYFNNDLKTCDWPEASGCIQAA